MRYEDLISDPSKQLKNICNYLNVQYSNKMLEFYKNNDEPSDFLDWKKNTLNPVNKDNQKKYLKILEESEVKEFNSVAKEMLTQFNYL